MFKYAVLLFFLSLGNINFCQDPMNYMMDNSGVMNDDRYVRDYLENKYATGSMCERATPYPKP